MLNSLFIRALLICTLCLPGFIFTGCREHSAVSTIGPAEPIELSAHEQVYEGFIISGAKGEAFVRKIEGLRKPGQLYWVDYDPTAVQEKQIWGEIRRAGERINWPSRANQSRIIQIKFIAKE